MSDTADEANSAGASGSGRDESADGREAPGPRGRSGGSRGGSRRDRALEAADFKEFPIDDGEPDASDPKAGSGIVQIVPDSTPASGQNPASHASAFDAHRMPSGNNPNQESGMFRWSPEGAGGSGLIGEVTASEEGAVREAARHAAPLPEARRVERSAAASGGSASAEAQVGGSFSGMGARPKDFKVASPGAGPLWLMRLLLLGALAISGYLAYLTLVDGGQPAGCGAGSDCDAVLRSPWSSIFGVPVSLLASGVYVAMLLASFGTGRSVPEARRRFNWGLVLAGAWMVAWAAAWFIALQLLVMRQICPWCMAAHVLGLAAFAVALYAAPVSWISRRGKVSAEEPHAMWGLTPGNVKGLMYLAMVLVGGLLIAGALAPSEGTLLVTQGSASTGAATEQRTVGIATGGTPIQVAFVPHEVPVVGSPGAPYMLLYMFDYTCPHCRRLHEMLEPARERYGGRLSIVAMPVPLDSTCNDAVSETKPSHANACEYAKMGLAVYHRKREMFHIFHTYMFSGAAVPPLAEARRQAAYLLGGEDVLDAAMAESWVSEQIQKNVNLYKLVREQAGMSIIPQLHGGISFYGVPGTAEDLYRALEEDLGLKPSSSAPPLEPRSEPAPTPIMEAPGSMPEAKAAPTPIMAAPGSMPEAGGPAQPQLDPMIDRPEDEGRNRAAEATAAENPAEPEAPVTPEAPAEPEAAGAPVEQVAE